MRCPAGWVTHQVPCCRQSSCAHVVHPGGIAHHGGDHNPGMGQHDPNLTNILDHSSAQTRSDSPRRVCIDQDQRYTSPTSSTMAQPIGQPKLGATHPPGCVYRPGPNGRQVSANKAQHRQPAAAHQDTSSAPRHSRHCITSPAAPHMCHDRNTWCGVN